MSNNEFKFFGKTIEDVSIGYGIILVLFSAGISWISGSESVTSWIPAFLGLPILLFGSLAKLKPNGKKLFMHISVLFGLVAFLGGLDLLRGVGSDLGPFANLYAGISKLILLTTGALYCYLCIRSFRFARRNKIESDSTILPS